jgi:hypothetical protein
MTVLEQNGSRATAERGTAAAVLSPILCLIILAASLLIPIVAHGCHGDDVDHEPGATRRR